MFSELEPEREVELYFMVYFMSMVKVDNGISHIQCEKRCYLFQKMK